MESVREKSMVALVGLFVAAACTALWVGLKDMFSK
jgi:hypothetical protein